MSSFFLCNVLNACNGCCLRESLIVHVMYQVTFLSGTDLRDFSALDVPTKHKVEQSAKPCVYCTHIHVHNAGIWRCCKRPGIKCRSSSSLSTMLSPEISARIQRSLTQTFWFHPGKAWFLGILRKIEESRLSAIGKPSILGASIEGWLTVFPCSCFDNLLHPLRTL